jgi:hypothetical protein
MKGEIYPGLWSSKWDHWTGKVKGFGKRYIRRWQRRNANRDKQ